MKLTTLAVPLRVLIVIFCSCSAPASSAGEPAPWRFGQLLQATLSSHPALLGKRAEQAAAQSELDGAKWQRFPALSVESATPTGGGQSSVVRLEQTVWDGGRVKAGIDAAGGRFDAAGAALDEQALALSLRLIAAFTEALRQQARQQYATEAVAQHQKLLDMIGRRVGQEVSSQTDYRLAESRLYQAVNEQSAAAQALGNALLQLAALAGASVTQVAPLAPSAASIGASLAQAQAQALDYAPALRRLAFEEASAGADIAGRRAAYLPQLALRLEKSRGQVSDSRAMLVLTAQPGAGLSALSGVSAAQARRDAVRLAIEAAQRDTRERLAIDWSEWQAARARLDNASRSSEMSGQVFDSYTRQYVIGRKSWSDVLNAVRELTQAQFALEDARAQSLAAQLRLSAQCGTLKQDSGASP